MDAPIDQSQDGGSGGLVEMLSSLLSPQSAEAASVPNPQMQAYQQLRALNQIKQQEQAMAIQKQRFALEQARQQQLAPQRELQQQKLEQQVTAGAKKAAPASSISELISKPTAAPAARIEAPIFGARTPGTGTPWFGNVPPKWASPELRAQLLAAQPGQAVPEVGGTSTPETPRALTPEKVELAGKIAEQLKNVPPEARSVLIESMVPELATAVSKADVLKKTRDKRAQWEASPAPTTGIYLDAKGNPYYPTLNSDREQGGVFYGLNTPQGKLAASTPLLLSHVLQTVDEVSKVTPKGKAAFQNWIAAKIREWNGNPAQRAIGSLLDPASAMAVGTLYASGGAPTRGGVRMAEMFRNSFYSPGDSVPVVKEKLSVALGLLQDIATRQNLHPRFLKEIQDAQKKVTEMGGSSQPQTFNAFPDATQHRGRELRGSDGSRWMSNGQTWQRIP